MSAPQEPFDVSGSFVDAPRTDPGPALRDPWAGPERAENVVSGTVVDGTTDTCDQPHERFRHVSPRTLLSPTAATPIVSIGVAYGVCTQLNLPELLVTNLGTAAVLGLVLVAAAVAARRLWGPSSVLWVNAAAVALVLPIFTPAVLAVLTVLMGTARTRSGAQL